MIDKYIHNFRTKLQSNEVYVPTGTNKESPSDKELLVIEKHDIRVLEEFLGNMGYLNTSILEVTKNINRLYTNIYKKLDLLEEKAEGYQRLNTSELDTSDTIEDLKIPSLKDRSMYDNYLKGLALPRLSSYKGIFAQEINRGNLGATEIYKYNNTKTDSLLNINALDEYNTIVKSIEFYGKRNKLLASYSGRYLLDIPEGTQVIKVQTDNVDKDVTNYTSMDILAKNYVKQDTVTLDDIVFSKSSKLLKLVIDSSIPTSCSITAKVTVRNNKVNETLVFSVQNNREVYVNKEGAQGAIRDLRGNTLSIEEIGDEDVVLVQEYSTGDSIKHLGNKVFDISKLNKEGFTLTISFTLYSLYDDTKSPVIKGVYAYVTE